MTNATQRIVQDSSRWTELPVAYVVIHEDGSFELASSSLMSELPPGMYLLAPHKESLTLEAVDALVRLHGPEESSDV